jgi:hypothetical protein
LTYLQECHGQEIPASVLQTLAKTRRTPAEVLELAVMARRDRWRQPVAVDRCLLIAAEFFRLAQLRTGIAVAAMIPDFIRYRLGIVSWRGWLRNRLWRIKQGLRHALG